MSDSPQFSIPNTPDGESDNNGFSQVEFSQKSSLRYSDRLYLVSFSCSAVSDILLLFKFAT